MSFEIGERVGKYVIRGRLGSGAMGLVFRATDPDLGRDVALKVLAPPRGDGAGVDTEGRARLIREARAAAQLSHPNVVVVHEVGEHAGAPYLAMELVEGTTLRAWLAERERPWREIVAMIAQAGRGLAAAHERGLVHRDFKPDNVLVDRAGRAKVADFGLARARDTMLAAAAEAPTLDGHAGDAKLAVDPRLARMTATGSLAGTPAYMSPELVDGAPPDARSDQFALAVVLYEALRGQHPFAGTTPRALWNEMAAGNVRDGGRAVPAWLDQIARRGLAADPAARWPSVAALIDALDAGPPSAPRRSRKKLAIGASAGAVAIGAVIAIAARSHPAAHAPGPSVPQRPAQVAAAINGEPRRPAPDERDPNDGTDDPDDPFDQADGVGERLTCGDEPRMAAWPAQRAKDEKALAETPDRGAFVLGAFDAFVEAWRAAVGEACKLDDPAPRLGCLHRLRIQATAAFYGVRSNKAGARAIAESLPSFACVRGALPADKRAREQVEKAERDLARGIIGRDGGEMVFALRQTDWAAGEADRGGEPALAARARLLHAEMCRLVDNHKCSSHVLGEAQANARAAKDAALSYEVELASIIDDPKTATDAALAPFAHEDARLRALLGDAHLAVARRHDTEGDDVKAVKSAALAEAAYRAAQTMRDRAQPTQIGHAIGAAQIGVALVAQHRGAEAQPSLAIAVAALDAVASPQRPESIEALRALATAEVAAGRVPRAQQIMVDLIARRTKVLSPHDERLADDWHAFADALGKAGHRAEQCDALEAAIGELEHHGNRIRVANTRVDLATAQVESAQYDAAEATLAQAMPVLVREQGPDTMDVAAAEYVLVRARVERVPPAKLPETAKVLAHVEQVFAKSFGASSQGMVAVLELKAQLASAQRDFAGAERQLTLALGLLGDNGADLDFRGEIAYLRAQALWHLDRQAEARASADASIRDYEAAGPAFAPQLAKSRAWLAAPK